MEFYPNQPVLLSNLCTFVLAGIDAGGRLVELARFNVVAPPEDLDASMPAFADPPDEFLGLLDVGCSTRSTLRDPQHVARLLAWHGRQILQAIKQAGRQPGVTPKRLLEPIAEVFERGLNVTLADGFLVPTIVQTLVYGLLAAWLQDDATGDDFEWQGAAFGVQVPLFAELLHACLRPALVRHADLFARLDAVEGRLVDWVLPPHFEVEASNEEEAQNLGAQHISGNLPSGWGVERVWVGRQDSRDLVNVIVS